MTTVDRVQPSTVTERGTGLLSAVIGIGVVMAILGFAVNVTLGLWTRSTVDAVAYDAARRVATADPGIADRTGMEKAAIADAKALLGAYGNKVTMRFVEQPDTDVVVLQVRAPGVALLPKLIHGGSIVGGMDRQIVVRREGR